MNDFKLVSCDTLIAKISDQLSNYVGNSIFDEGRLYAEILWVVNKLGIPAYDLTDAIVKLDNHKCEMPCDFFLLDSAFLCDKHSDFDTVIPQPESKFIIYNRQTTELISQDLGCDGGSPPSANRLIDDDTFQGVRIEACNATHNNEQVLEKVTSIDYIAYNEPIRTTWHNPILLTLRKNKSVKNICSKDCKNLFATGPYEISIEQQGNSYYIYSTMKKPVIYLKYYRYPVDLETGLPLIPEEPIIQKAIEYHLMYYFFYMAWLNNDDVNIERKVKDLEVKAANYLAEAKNYTKLPSFLTMVNLMKKKRSLWRSYEIGMSSQHV